MRPSNQFEFQENTDETQRAHIQKFIDDNFSAIRNQASGELTALIDTATHENKFRLKNTPHEFSITQLQAIADFLVARHYDGRLRAKLDKEIIEESWGQATCAALKNLANIPALIFQTLNLLETTAILTAIWQYNREYYPDWKAYALMGTLALSMLRSNYTYVTMRGKVSRQEIHDEHEAIHDDINQIIDNLKTAFDDSERARAFLRRATTPSFLSRLEQEGRLWLASLTKLIAVFATLSAELKGQNFWLIAGISTLVGIIEAIDTAFNGALAIPFENDSVINRWRRNILPPVEAEDRALFFPRAADFSPIPVFMGKAGSLAWLAVRTRASVTCLETMGLNSSDIPGGLYGIYTISFIGSLVISTAFMLYNVLENLGKELPTKRDFEYTHKRDWTSLGYVLAGATPPAAIAGLIAYLSTVLGDFNTLNKLIISGTVIAVTEAATATALWRSSAFAKRYAHLAELRFIPDLFARIDNLHVSDKAALSLIGLAAEAAGRTETFKNMYANYVSTATGDALLFLMGTAFVAEFSKSRASQIRYATAQMFLYAVALLTWVLNTVLSYVNLGRGMDVSDHPVALTKGDPNIGLYLLYIAGPLVLGYAAGTQDYDANGEKVEGLTEEVKSHDERHSYIASAASGLLGTASWVRNHLPSLPNCLRTRSSKPLDVDQQEELRDSQHIDTP